MLPVSSSFLAAVRGSHTATSRATLCNPTGQTGVTPTGTTLTIVDGSVTLDATAAIRGTLDLEVIATWPTSGGINQLTPYGSEVFLTRGIDLGNGRFERAPLGYYRITSVEQAEDGGPLRIAGQDRMGGILEARLLAPVQYAASAGYAAVITALVQDVYPGATIDFTWPDGFGGGTTLGRKVVVEDDRYAFLDGLIRGIGCIWYWDYRGRLVVKPVPAPSGSPVWSVNAGPNGVLTSVSRSRSREGVYNAVVVTGEGLDDTKPAYGVAKDLDPSSVTYWGGPYGKVPLFVSDPTVTTNAQAATAAAGQLLLQQGLPYDVAFTEVVNPALEPYDVVELVPPERPGRTVVVESHVLDALSVPLGSDGAQSCRTRLSKAVVV